MKKKEFPDLKDKDCSYFKNIPFYLFLTATLLRPLLFHRNHRYIFSIYYCRALPFHRVSLFTSSHGKHVWAVNHCHNKNKNHFKLPVKRDIYLCLLCTQRFTNITDKSKTYN